MRVGLQTISLGMDCAVSKVLSDIKAAGFDGIELAQVQHESSESEFFDAMGTAKIDLIGVSGGTLDEKLRLVTAVANIRRPVDLPYVYVDEWDEKLNSRYDSILRNDLEFKEVVYVAIHPHMFKPIQTAAEAIEVVKRYRYAKLLPDTAHLTVAGDDILKLIDSQFENIIAVHLKDWSPEFGRTFPFYSRGFVELGRGRVPILRTIELLKSRQYTGWLIVEQDYSPEPLKSAKRSRSFLKSHGI